jgi:hypothetical protein
VNWFPRIKFLQQICPTIVCNLHTYRLAQSKHAYVLVVANQIEKQKRMASASHSTDGGSRTRPAGEGKCSKRTEAGQPTRGLRAVLDRAGALGRLALAGRLAPLVSPLALEKRSRAGGRGLVGRESLVGLHQ